MARVLAVAGILLSLPALAWGQAAVAGTPDTSATRIGVRGDFAAPAMRLRIPPQYLVPWYGGPRVPPGLALAARDAQLAAALDSATAARVLGNTYLSLYGLDMAAADSMERELRKEGVLGISRKVVDLTLDGTVRLELAADRLKNLRCTPASVLDPTSGCRGDINGPRILNQFNVRSGGVIGQRLRVNVDWDSQRDFVNSNNIQVWYEGLEDEFVRRLEVGSVAFRPPPSRYLTSTIPTNNFGINAVFQYGALEMQTLFATQNGSAVAERVYSVGQTTSEPQDRAQRDLDFEYGRFFWLVDPRTLPGYPAVDVLTADTITVAPSVRPAQVRIYRYRVPQQSSGIDPNLGGIPACAIQGPGGREFGPVPWQLLVLGTDYYLDPSGLWIAFAQRVDLRNDFIAVSYITEDGQVVGSFPDVPNPAAGLTCSTVDSLRMVAEPLVGPDQPSFHHEMRQFYRIAGQDMDLASLEVDLALNRIERPLPPSAFATYLAALGLSVPTDPEVVDRVNRVFPRVRDPGAVEVIRESFLVFPHATPFNNAAALAQPSERSDSLYRTPVFLLFSQGPPSRFQMRFRYNSLGAGDRSILRLNALQIREGSDKLFVGGRELIRGEDYTIAYETGEVTFLNPDLLFGAGAAQVTARFEERGLFAVAPTSILGFTGRYDLGTRGVVNVMALYQREQSAFIRPALGFEAQANLIAGANTQLSFQPRFLANLVGDLTRGRLRAPTILNVNGELAFTRPDPNRTGQAFLDEFEAEAGTPVSLREVLWEYGSRAQSTDGIDPAVGLGAQLDVEDAVQLTWQNLVVQDLQGNLLQFFPSDIDPNIQTAGEARVPETVLFLTLQADTAGGIVRRNGSSRWTQPERPGRPRWRSMQTSLSTVGLDFSRSTFIEFWLYETGDRPASAAAVNLILDVGSVNEDAIALAPEVLVPNQGDTIYTGRQYVGLGVLNSERRTNGIFNAESDDIGILGDIPDLVDEFGQPLPGFPLCSVVLGTAVQAYPWGDLATRCTRGNGVLNTEDLDGDNTLNARGGNDNVRRYVVNLADSQYVVRAGVTDPATGSGWRLYRIPLRDPAATIGTPNERLVQHLRVTVAAPDQGFTDREARFALARFRFVGAPWVARAPTPIQGIAGSIAEPNGSVVISTISTLDSTDLGYVSPPGTIGGQAQVDPGTGLNSGVQINEKALRVVATGLVQNTRGEGYLRFPAGAQRFLGYRELRVWMRGARNQPAWEAGEVEGYIKVESDENNFYMYRTPLRSNGGQDAWNPEVRVDLDTWRNLRAQIETRVQQGLPPSGADTCGGDPGAYVVCQGPYVVHILNPFANPPNLNSVQALATGILRVGTGTSDSVEMWVNDVRLANPVSDLGVAYALDARMSGGDVFDISVVATNLDGNFRPLGAQPTFRTTSSLQTAGSLRLDRFLSPRLGLLLPLTVTYGRTAIDPILLSGSDIEGAALPGLRKPDNRILNVGFAVRRSVRGTNVLTRTLVDPLTLAVNLTRGRAQTELSRTQTDGYNVQLGWSLASTRSSKPLGLGGLSGALPGFLRDSDFGKSLGSAGYTLMPASLRFQSGLARDESRFFTYVSPVNRAVDSLIQPALALQHLWRTSAGFTWQPLGLLLFGADYTTVRDLRNYGDTTELGRLATAERQSLAGVDVGVERDRNFTTTLSLQPRLASWLRPRFSTNSAFQLNRQLNSRQVVENDSTGAFWLPQTYTSSRANELAIGLDYARGVRQIVGDSSGAGNLIRRFRAIDFSYRVVRSSTYDLVTFDPSLSYMLGLGSTDQLLEQNGQLALGASRGRTITAATGFEFPFGLVATLNYTDGIIERYQLIGTVQRPATIKSKEWPSGSLRFNRPFTRGPLALMTLGATLRNRRGSTEQPAVEGTNRSASLISSQSRNLLPELAVTFRNGLAIVGSLSLIDQEAVANGVATILDQVDLNATASYAFRLPSAISRARKLARSSMSVTLGRADQCLQRQTQPDCQVISDNRRQEYRGTFDTDVLQNITAGLQIGYTINEFRHLDRKNSQLFLVASMTLSLFAGDFR